MTNKEKFQNPIERIVFEICKKSFFSMWSYANPRKNGDTKELCDILVVFDPHILIFSIKHIDFHPDKSDEVHYKRWWKRAIDSSVKQIYGAERDLQNSTQVFKSNGNPGLPLPSLSARLIHRISISLGSKALLPLYMGDFGKGYVHVFEEETFMVLMHELDTITDFVQYLTTKEVFSTNVPNLIVEGFEKNLLAYYLFNNREIPACKESLIITEDNWERLIADTSYIAKKEADKISYFWDRLIELLSSYILNDQMEFGSTLSENERVIRYMAREFRFSRRILSESYSQFRNLAKAHSVISRIVPSPSGTTYVFFAPPPEMDREIREMELKMRCFIARNDIRENPVVVGIGSNVDATPKGFAMDLVLLEMPNWTIKDEEEANEIRRELGFFENPDRNYRYCSEYIEKID